MTIAIKLAGEEERALEQLAHDKGIQGQVQSALNRALGKNAELFRQST